MVKQPCFVEEINLNPFTVIRWSSNKVSIMYMALKVYYNKKSTGNYSFYRIEQKGRFSV